MLELDLSLDLEPLSGEALLQQLLGVTEDAGLPFPPVPPALVPALRVLGDMRFGTRPGPAPMLDLPAWRDEWLNAGTPEYVVYGIEGRGAVSQVLHYYLVSGPVAVFLQHRVAGPDAGAQAGRMTAMLTALPRLMAQAEAARRGGRLAPDQVAALVDSDLHGRAWALVRPGAPAAWHSDGPQPWDGLRAALG